jgi:hypothetical protein
MKHVNEKRKEKVQQEVEQKRKVIAQAVLAID